MTDVQLLMSPRKQSIRVDRLLSAKRKELRGKRITSIIKVSHRVPKSGLCPAVWFAGYAIEYEAS